MRLTLRERTAPQHEQLDQAISARCFGARMDVAALLTVHAATLPGLVLALDRAGIADTYPGWDGPDRLALLQADLAALDQPMPMPLPAPAALDPSQAAGVLYAMEGSSLGNQMLLRRVGAEGAARDQAATRFLGHGAATGAWPRFTRWLNAREARLNPDAVVAGAVLAFEQYTAAVRRLPAPMPAADPV